MLINPYAFGAGGGGPSDANGCLVYRDGSDTTTSPVPWNATSYDPGNWHDTVTNPSRITLPSAVTYARVIACLLSDDGRTALGMLKNGSAFTGGGEVDIGAVTTGLCNIWSAAVAVDGARYFETAMAGDSTPTAKDDNFTWMAVEKVDPAMKRCLLHNSAGQSYGTSMTTLDWDEEPDDVDGFHEGVTNPSRITIISGVTLVQLFAGVDFGNQGGQCFASMLKNGASFIGKPNRDVAGTTSNDRLCLASAVLVVTTSDYFQAQAGAGASGTTGTGGNNFYALLEIPSSWDRCLAQKSAGQAISAGVDTAVTFDGSDVYDTASIHDPAVNNTDFVTPAGKAQVKVIFNLTTPSVSGDVQAWAVLNGTKVPGMPAGNTDTLASDSLNGEGTWIDTVAGDIVKLMYNGPAITLAASDSMWMNVLYR